MKEWISNLHGRVQHASLGVYLQVEAALAHPLNVLDHVAVRPVLGICGASSLTIIAAAHLKLSLTVAFVWLDNSALLAVKLADGHLVVAVATELTVVGVLFTEYFNFSFIDDLR